MNTEAFTGKAQAYAAARPGYPTEAIEYIRTLAPPMAVLADIGAGTGKFTKLIARYGYEIFAIEPNADMRTQLTFSLASFTNVIIIDSIAEAMPLPNHSVDAIICSQSLVWLDLNAFRKECRRVGKPGAVVISLFNKTPGDHPALTSHRLTSEQASEKFFINPEIRAFPNPILYTHEKWLQKNTSISDNPLPSDRGYDAHLDKINEVFESCSIDGFLREDLMTMVYSEKLLANLKVG